MAYRFQLRRDSAAHWATVNPVLYDGEPGYDYTNNELRIGDGETEWNDLPIFAGPGAPGPPGPPGPPGSGALVFEQPTPLAEWSFHHGLGHLPLVTIYISGEQVFAPVDADSENVIVTFPSPESGELILS